MKDLKQQLEAMSERLADEYKYSFRNPVKPRLDIGLTEIEKHHAQGFNAAIPIICELAEALEFYADKETYGSDDKSRTSGNECFDIVCFDFDRNLEPKRDYAGAKAKYNLNKLKQFVGEK